MTDSLKLLFSFKGKIGRQQFLLGNVSLIVFYTAFDLIFIAPREGMELGYLDDVWTLVMLVVLFCHFVLCIKRLRELEKSGAWSFLILLPPISLILYYWIFFKKPAT